MSIEDKNQGEHHGHEAKTHAREKQEQHQRERARLKAEAKKLEEGIEAIIQHDNLNRYKKQQPFDGDAEAS